MQPRRLFMFVLATIMMTASYGYSVEEVVSVDELIDIAKKSLVVKNQLLVNGYSSEDVDYFPLAQSYRKSFNADSEKIIRHRDLLIDDNQDYADFQTELTVNEKQVTKTEALLKASEYTVFRLHKADTDPLSPKTTEYVQEHLFRFVHDGEGQWKLASDELINQPAPVIPKSWEEAEKIDVEPTVLDEYSTVENSSQSVSEDAVSEDDDALVEGAKGMARKKAKLNRKAIVKYALKYWKKYNPKYRRFRKDCTNFVSQAVRAGNWRFVKGWYRSPKVWWYNWGNQSWTWAGAHNWFRFIQKRRRGHIAKYFSQMKKGDILQMDFNRDGFIDHSMIVTKKDKSKTIYLTYHTGNTKNKSIKAILARYPKAAYYGWRLYGKIK